MNAIQTKARALIVEDDRSWQQILEEILMDMGLEVDTADNIETAVAYLRDSPHRLAIVDLSLGGHDHTNQDGLQVLDAVRLHDPHCTTLLLTGYATVEIAVSSLTEHGAFTCLRKSAFRRSEFGELVRQILAQAPAPEEFSAASSGDSPQANASVKSEEFGGECGVYQALVVEDDASWRNIFWDILSEAGYRVRLCGSFGEGLGYLRREKYDIAILDLSLSSSDTATIDQEGYRLLGYARQARIPTLVVSGTASPEDIERAYTEYGAIACLEKQAFDRRAFLRMVEEAQKAAEKSSDLDCLTEREREVLELLVQGMANKDIAESLIITNNTVKRHLKAIFEKLEVHTRAAAVAKAINAGIPAQPRSSQ